MLDINPYKSLLCLDGDLPDRNFFKQFDLPIIAADGVANRLTALGIQPTLIIGDLDSVYPQILAEYPFIHVPCQNSNDYQKALQYMEAQDLLPAIIVGIQGGMLDHVLNNINIFMQGDNLLYAPPICGIVLKENTSRELLLPLETKISLIGIPTAMVSSQGLQWELERAQLAFPGQSSCFNRSILPTIKLEVLQGDALLLIYEETINDAALVIAQ